jgi:hypothetical protein
MRREDHIQPFTQGSQGSHTPVTLILARPGPLSMSTADLDPQMLTTFISVTASSLTLRSLVTPTETAV